MLKEVELLSEITNPNILVNFFNERFSPETFLNIWYYMQGYINITESTALGQYFCKSKPLPLHHIMRL